MCSWLSLVQPQGRLYLPWLVELLSSRAISGPPSLVTRLSSSFGTGLVQSSRCTGKIWSRATTVKLVYRQDMVPGTLRTILKREGTAGSRKLVAPPILLVAPPILMELPYVGHQMLNFI